MKDSQRWEDATPVQGEATCNDNEKPQRQDAIGPAGTSRRSFLGKVGGATAAALAVGIPLEPFFKGKHGEAEASVVSYRPNNRAMTAGVTAERSSGREDRPRRAARQRRFTQIHRLQRKLEQMPEA